MGRRFTVVAVMPLLLTSAAWGQAPATQSRSDSEYTETLYATDQHMGFSIRTTLVRWLGGVDVSKQRDAKAAQKEGWWGDPVPQVSPEVLGPGQSSDR